MKTKFFFFAALALLVVSTECFPASEEKAPAESGKPALTEVVRCPTKSEEARQHYNNGLQLRSEGNQEAAEREYLAAIDLDQNYCDAMDNLGQLLRQQGKVDQAVYWYKRSIAVLPTNHSAHTNLAVAYSYQGKNEEAIAEYRYLLKMDSNDPEGYYGLGTIYLSTGKPDLAIENFKSAEKIYEKQQSPLLSDARFALGVTYFNQKNYAQARDYLEKSYTAKQHTPAANYLLGICYLEGKQLDLAKKFLGKARELGAKIPPEVMKKAGM